MKRNAEMMKRNDERGRRVITGFRRGVPAGSGNTRKGDEG
jgi:hypothetical protein